VEYGYGGRLITDDATWTVSETTRGSFWGHRMSAPPATGAGGGA
jgi:hypothetical protein